MLHATTENFLLRMLDAKFAGYEFAFFHGSRTRNDFREDSDYDLIIIYSKNCESYRENFFFEGKQIDAFVYDIQAINFKLDNCVISNNFVLPDMVKDALILPKKNQIAEFLITKANAIASGPIAPIPLFIAAMNYQYIANSIAELRKISDKNELIFIAIDLVKILNEIMLAQCNQGGNNRTKTARALRKHDSKYYFSVFEIFNEITMTGSCECLIRTAEIVLNYLPQEARNIHKVQIPVFGRTPVELTDKADLQLNDFVLEHKNVLC